MKTAEALKIAGNCARMERDSANYWNGTPSGPIHGKRADALDQLRADHRLLRSELTKVRGMLAYFLDGLRADRVDLDGGNKDVRHIKQQLKVAAHILKVTKP